MAIMGPSGCGKTSLLTCIADAKKNGITGSITISTEQEIKFAYIAQDDYLEKKFTIKESLLYASKLKNETQIDHKLNVENIINSLNIKDCANNKPKRCSGGQKKRISIALELVSRPNLLILDEPTSGLDTVTTWQLVKTLIDLVNGPEPMAVVATIHQPSAKLFNLFNLIYIMSSNGRCIYHGVPQTLIYYLKQNGLNCPQFHNPSDFVLEVASEEHGIDKVMQLSTCMAIEAMDLNPYLNPIQTNRDYNTLRHVWILTQRTFIQTIRDPFMLPIRIIGHMIVAWLFVEFWGKDSGELSGCADNFAIKSGDFVKNFEEVSNKLGENTGLIYFILLFIWFGSIFAVLLTFPLEMNIFIKEYRNGWYSGFSYLMSKMIVDLLFQVAIPPLMSIPAYLYTGQYAEESWRTFNFIIICFLMALCASSQGLMTSAWLMKWPGPAAFVGIVSAFPMVLFSGFMIPINDMPSYFRWISWGNFMRFGLEAAIVNTYGFDRCGDSVRNKTDWASLVPNDVLVEIYSSDKINLDALLSVLNFFTGQSLSDTKSIVLSKYGYTDNTLYYAFIMLFVIMVLAKILTYLSLLKRIN